MVRVTGKTTALIATLSNTNILVVIIHSYNKIIMIARMIRRTIVAVEAIIMKRGNNCNWNGSGKSNRTGHGQW